jgi:hypothetical protein
VVIWRLKIVKPAQNNDRKEKQTKKRGCTAKSSWYENRQMLRIPPFHAANAQGSSGFRGSGVRIPAGNPVWARQSGLSLAAFFPDSLEQPANLAGSDDDGQHQLGGCWILLPRKV